jgi:hypothetical protein
VNAILFAVFNHFCFLNWPGSSGGDAHERASRVRAVWIGRWQRPIDRHVTVIIGVVLEFRTIEHYVDGAGIGV